MVSQSDVPNRQLIPIKTRVGGVEVEVGSVSQPPFTLNSSVFISSVAYLDRIQMGYDTFIYS